MYLNELLTHKRLKKTVIKHYLDTNLYVLITCLLGMSL